MNPRYLTKSKFKLALECPTKLYYDGKAEYANQNIEDPFLEALADGGFQVSELAKQYLSGGHEIKTLDYEEALAQTNELLKQENVTIYEAAIRFNNLFVRVDILRKNNNKIELLEVKAKSIDPSRDSFLKQNGEISREWLSYLSDVAFQKHVAMKCFPHHEISAYLMMADKNATCPTSGLNQKFKMGKDANGRKTVMVSQPLSPEDLAEMILVKVNVDECCAIIYSGQENNGFEGVSFGEYVALLADHYQHDKKISWPLSVTCAKCQYRANEQDKALGLKSGFEECWKEKLKWTDDDFEHPNVFEIWNYRKKDQHIKEGRIKLSEMMEEDIAPKADKKPGLSPSQRQWLQVQKVQCKDGTCWVDVENLGQEMSGWTYPLHFIDFETSSVAIPFNKGRRPYEGIAFQFSHHVVHEDGQVEHRGQYLNVEPGKFPNYDFIRNLKTELEQDNGSIFRYAAHENTYLNLIYKQLMEDQEEIPDREELCNFIRTITQSVGSSDAQWKGARNMIDMCELVKRYYYSPDMRGSNSIKKVLPAILNSSRVLQEKYSKPIYGAQGGITSLNYNNWKWIEFDNDSVKDPYKLLPKMFQDVSDKDFELLSDSEELNNGGAALTAYARLQFEEMTDYERQEIHQALLKYCELDTLAMVMIYEAWRDMVFLEGPKK